MHDVTSSAFLQPPVHASPAVSEMVYEMLPRAADSRFSAVHEGDDASYHSSPESMRNGHHPPSEAGSALLDSNHARLPWKRVEQLPEKTGWADQGGDLSGMDESNVGATLVDQEYSGYSSEMRAAARATATALLAEASPSAHRYPQSSKSAQLSDEAHLDYEGELSASHPMGNVLRQDQKQEALLTVEEIERQIRVLQMSVGVQ
jgi:hypothetical protein